ncbi:hypothetical protein Sango_0369100 [Sesamum angolense]|uniref:Reverse transcriptase Ty1/copia-type domain-containing protein n=1 Tax=Sesamum angolense TaxID=2727404 RepID=A0AAE1XAB1_9LAMI|nr:hypothetical protein Sango_0369100 [Sesamum angolense]
MGYYFYDSFQQKIFVSRNAVFLKKKSPWIADVMRYYLSKTCEAPQQNNATSFEPIVSTDYVPILRRSTRESRLPDSGNVSLPLEKNRRYVISKGLSMALNKLLEVGTHVLMKLYGVLISSRTNVGDIKAWLSTQFSVKDMGDASYILGIKIYRDRSRRMLGLTQSPYIEKVLKRFKMENSKREFFPMRHGIKLSKKKSLKTDKEVRRMSDIPYASAVGSIQYVV